MSFTITKVYASDKLMNRQVDALLMQEGITRDANLDYTAAMLNDDYHVIATGSCFGNTLRCFAVDRQHQGEGLLNEIITHLIDVQNTRGNYHLFLYTKPDTSKFFSDLGFTEIARVPEKLVFMENRRDGFPSYLRALAKTRHEGNSAAIVMNANPFTLGHRYLIETASAACDTLHLFVVSEDASLVPYSVRRRLIVEGTADISNLILHDCGPYIISSATFPSYFLKDEATVIESQAKLDLAVFIRIAEALGITSRFVGEEPTSLVTGIYNRIMTEALPENGIRCIVIPRKESGGRPISASTVRQLLAAGDWDSLSSLVPETTLAFFKSLEAEPILEKIRRSRNVVHY